MTLEFIVLVAVIYLLFGNKLIKEEEQDDDETD